MRSYRGLTKRRFLVTMSSCVLVGPTQYEPTLADYIREDERIEAIRRLKLSKPTDARADIALTTSQGPLIAEGITPGRPQSRNVRISRPVILPLSLAAV
jgi:hypothetical protein